MFGSINLKDDRIQDVLLESAFIKQFTRNIIDEPYTVGKNLAAKKYGIYFAYKLVAQCLAQLTIIPAALFVLRLKTAISLYSKVLSGRAHYATGHDNAHLLFGSAIGMVAIFPLLYFAAPLALTALTTVLPFWAALTTVLSLSVVGLGTCNLIGGHAVKFLANFVTYLAEQMGVIDLLYRITKLWQLTAKAQPHTPQGAATVSNSATYVNLMGQPGAISSAGATSPTGRAGNIISVTITTDGPAQTEIRVMPAFTTPTQQQYARSDTASSPQLAIAAGETVERGAVAISNS